MQRHEGGYYIRLSVLDRPGRRRRDRHAAWPSARSRSNASCSASDLRASRDRRTLRRARTGRADHLCDHEAAIRAALDAVIADGHIAEPPQVIRIERDESGRNERSTTHRKEPTMSGHHPTSMPPRDVIERILSHGARARHRARRRRPLRGCAATATRRRPTRPPSTPCAASSTSSPIDGTIVIGEGERDEAPMLFIGENVGNGQGPKVDIAVDPLEGTTLCAKDMPGAIAVMAMAAGGLAALRARRLHGQDRHRPRLCRRASSISTPARPTTSTRWPRPRA